VSDRTEYFRQYHARRFATDPDYVERRRKTAREHSRRRIRDKAYRLRRKLMDAAREEALEAGTTVGQVLASWGATP
jgi:hypothetical protein